VPRSKGGVTIKERETPRRPRKLTLKLLWDVLMVWVALINLGLIVFDLSYLLVRPIYFRYLPVVTRVYDPVKGIEDHPLTKQLIRTATETRQLLALDPGSPRIDERVTELRELTLRVIEENPFERSGQTRNLERMRAQMATALGQPSSIFDSEQSRQEAIEQLWTRQPEVLESRLELFATELEPQLAVNYYREIDLSGQLVDYFCLLDLPFLLLFWVEFMVRWGLAIRKHAYAKWFFFPIFYWYDLLGLVPSAYFRPFRLLRAAGIYLRLRRSELSVVGDDLISRSIAYFSNIITEEVSDMVSLRILNEYQEEIRDGTHIRIFEQTIGARRHVIHHVMARQLRNLLTDRAAIAELHELLQLNLEHAVQRSETLHSIPLPSAVVRPVVRAVGEVLLETTLETVVSTLETDEGRESIDRLVAAVLDHLLTGPGIVELETVTKEIALDVMDHMKQAVAVKKWAEPSPQPALPNEDGDKNEDDEAGPETAPA